MSLETLSARHARYRRDHAALVFAGQRLTHAELDARANRAANGLLGLGLRTGDRVALLLDNSVEPLELYLAAMKTGLVVVPLSPLLRAEGLLNLLLDAGVAALVTMERLAPEVATIRQRLALPGERLLIAEGSYRALAEAASPESPPPPPPGLTGDEALNIVYSSGTTGEPKGIVHTHRIREA